ncbi:hypothetical protein HID58_086263 [Brassica napus]|uniref:Protein kinase domain-containing protein n=1 Tax=Brassica napus TaxID=3708 RepID=A0ABQ7XPZ4_BRANA|nr:hypothetical protein HID58_086263 [Brassica napus]
MSIHKKRNTTNRDGTDLPGRSHQRSSNTTSASICCPEPRVPERTASRVWNRPGETQIFNNPSSWAQAARLISPLPLAHTREKMTKLRSMVSILINKSQNQETTYRIIANWLEQAEKELAAHRAVAFERMSNKTIIREDNNEALHVVVVNEPSSLEFVSFLGKGGFGSVALMRDSKYQLYAEKSSPMDFIKSLEKEHRIMLRFRNHLRIIQTTSPNLHIGFNLDRCYINMEFASKGTFHNIISQLRGRPMPEFMVGRAALMILQGLEALHSQGYVHCDLKPANVLLFPSKTFGEPWDLKLADFGLSKEPGTDSRSSLSGGTPQYMPPESLGPNGVKMVGPAVDMWSLGCVVAEMFGGWPEKRRGCYAWRLPGLVSPVANDFLRSYGPLLLITLGSASSVTLPWWYFVTTLQHLKLR